MAFFDNNIFSPQTYQGGMSNWLADALRSGLLGRAIQPTETPMQPQTGPTFAQGNQGSMGGVPFPIMGEPQPVTTELSAQSRQPSAQPGFGNNLQAGLFNLSNANSPIGALIGGISGLATGQAIEPQIKPTDDMREFMFAKRQGFKGEFPEWLAVKRTAGGEFGKQPIWGIGPDGKPAIMQLSSTGKAVASQFPEGYSPAKDPIKMDAGTHWVILDPQTRQPVATIPKDIAGAEAAKHGGVNLTPGQKAIDTAFADDFAKWKSGGFADAERSMKELETALVPLTTKDNISGPVIGSIPEAVRKFTHPQSIATQEGVASVVQQSLRQILGGQFAMLEGIQLVKRAYNPDMPEAENARRVGNLLTQIKDAARAKQEAVDYFEKNGTLTGFKGKIPTISDFDPERASPKPQAASAQPAQPKIDEVRNGYRFRGGNPADPKNWQKVN